MAGLLPGSLHSATVGLLPSYITLHSSSLLFDLQLTFLFPLADQHLDRGIGGSRAQKSYLSSKKMPTAKLLQRTSHSNSEATSARNRHISEPNYNPKRHSPYHPQHTQRPSSTRFPIVYIRLAQSPKSRYPASPAPSHAHAQTLTQSTTRAPRPRNPLPIAPAHSNSTPPSRV